MIHWHFEHVWAWCTSNKHTLHFDEAHCCTPLAVSSTAVILLLSLISIKLWALSSVKTSSLAIYDHLCAHFHFWCWFSAKSFLFWLVWSTALCIVIWQPFTSWLSTYSVDAKELCIWCQRYCFISFVWCFSSTISWDVSAVQVSWVCECSCSKDIWYWMCRSDRTQFDSYDTSSVAAKLLHTLFKCSVSVWAFW